MSRVSLKAVAANAAFAVAAVALAACSDGPVQQGGSAALTPRAAAVASDVDAVVAGDVIVKVKDGASLDELVREHGLGRGARGYKGAFDIVKTAHGNERAMAARLAADSRVEYAEPNYIRHLDATNPLWAFSNPGGLNMRFDEPGAARDGTLLPTSYASKADADEDAIAGIAAGGGDVVVGTIDTGVDFNHAEFTGRLSAGCDWFSQAAAGNSSGTCSDFTPYDTPDEGHGTHTTGTMAGTNVGVAGVTGASSHVRVYVQRVCGPPGCYTSSIANAIRAAADQPNMVAMNLSLGGNSESSAEASAISYATGKGVLVIASAGNSGSGKVGCPACDANAISVAATNWQDQLAAYSQSGRGLDLSAPGGYCYSNTTEEGCIFSSIVSGYQGGKTYNANGDRVTGGAYAYMLGTSMAAPQVTGAAAAVASKTGLRGSALRARLEGTADDLGAAGYDTKFGNGRLNVYRALNPSASTTTQ